jgi:hypothetical protein
MCSRPIGKLRVSTPRTRIVFLRSPRCSFCGSQSVVAGDVERVVIPEPITFVDEMPLHRASAKVARRPQTEDRSMTGPKQLETISGAVEQVNAPKVRASRSSASG